MVHIRRAGPHRTICSLSLALEQGGQILRAVENAENLDSILIGVVEDQELGVSVAHAEGSRSRQLPVPDVATPSEFPVGREQGEGFMHFAQELKTRIETCFLHQVVHNLVNIPVGARADNVSVFHRLPGLLP